MANSEMRRNWPLLLVAFILVFFSFGIPTFSMPWMYPAAMEEFGWSREQVNYLSTSKFLTGAVMAVVMGALVDAIGARWITIGAAAVGGLGMFMLKFADNLPVYYFAGFLIGISAGGVMACMKVIVARVFEFNAAVAVGIVLSATSVAGVIMPQIWPPMIEWVGWRNTSAILGLGVFIFALPAWAVFLFSHKRLAEAVSTPNLVPRKEGMWAHFVRLQNDRNFWMIVIPVFLVSAVDQALMHNYVTFLREDRGLDWRAISWGGSLLALLGVVSKIGAGVIYDRFSIRGIVAFYFLLGISIWLALPVAGMATLLLFIVIRGLAHGAMIVDVPALTKHYFGPERFGLTMGILTLFVNLGFAVGPPLMGRMADLTGSYESGMMLYGFVALVAGLILMPVKPRYWARAKDKTTVEHANS